MALFDLTGMRKKMLLLLIPWVMVYFLSCSPVKELEMDVLEPAEISFPDDVFTLAFLIPGPKVKVNSRNQYQLDSIPENEFWKGIRDVAENSPRFNVNSLSLIGEYTDSLPEDTLDWHIVTGITDSVNVDMLVVMHPFTMVDSLKRKMVAKYNYEGYYYLYKIHSKATWRIYHPEKMKVLSDKNYDESYVWESLTDEWGAVIRLIDLRQAFSSAAYWSGHDIGQIMFPYWVKENRFYYIRGNRYFRQARDYVNQNNWQRAISIWKKNFKLNDPGAAYRAAHNIAFACEMMGKVELAIEWAENALDIMHKSQTRRYLHLLREREKKLEQIDQQMPI